MRKSIMLFLILFLMITLPPQVRAGDDTCGNVVEFDAESFSVYGVVYTIQYGEYSYELLGNQEVNLSELLDILEIGIGIGEVEEVVSSNEKILTVTEEVDDWLIKLLGEEIDTEEEELELPVEEAASLTVKATSGKSIIISLSPTGLKELDLDGTVIRAADGMYLPLDAEGHSFIQEDDEETIKAVEDYITIQNPDSPETLETNEDDVTEESFSDISEDKESASLDSGEEIPDFSSDEDDQNGQTHYTVFEIGLDNVDLEKYENGFDVSVPLPEDIHGKDFKLYHVHDGEISEVQDLSVDDGIVSFTTDSFSEFVLSYLVTYVLAADGETYKITVTYDETAGIPDGAKLRAYEILPEVLAYQEYYDESVQLLGIGKSNSGESFISSSAEIGTARFFDISIYNGDEKVIPASSVTVKIEYANSIPVKENEVFKVIHFGEDGTEILESQTKSDDNGVSALTFKTNGFSAFATISERVGADIANDCIAYFSFDDASTGFSGSGARADYRNNSDNSVTVSNSILRDGYSSRGIYLDGSHYLKVTKDDGNSLLTGLDEFTVSYWVYPDANKDKTWGYFAAPDGHVPTNYGAYGNDEHYIGVLHNYGVTTAERFNTHNSPRQQTVVTDETSLDEWHYITVVYKNNKTIVYVDGVEKGSANSDVDLSNLLGNNSYFNIGKATWGGGEYFNGYIDEFSVYKRALNDDEIAKLTNNAYFHQAIKVPVTDLQVGDKTIIYNKVWNTSKERYDYFAIAGDGTLVPVEDISDRIHWRNDTSIEWEFVVHYEVERDANGNIIYEGGEPKYVLDGSGNKIESGYYEFRNVATGKYLSPQHNGWSSENEAGLNLEGRRDGTYSSTIEQL